MSTTFARPARLTLTTDLENNGETFWTAFRKLDNNHPALVRWPELRKLRDGDGLDSVTIDASDTDTAEALPAFLAEIDGWDDGHERAPHPVIVQVECDEDEDDAADPSAEGWDAFQRVGADEHGPIFNGYPSSGTWGVIGNAGGWSLIDTDGAQSEGAPFAVLADAVSAAERRNSAALSAWADDALAGHVAAVAHALELEGDDLDIEGRREIVREVRDEVNGLNDWSGATGGDLSAAEREATVAAARRWLKTNRA